MRLSDFEGKYYCTIRDGEFETLGNVTSEVPCSFLTFAGSKDFLEKALKKENVSCIVISEDMEAEAGNIGENYGIAVAKSPKYAVQALHNELVATKDPRYITEAVKTTIGKDCDISSSAVIAETGVVIGNNVKIEENVIIREGVEIGDNCVIRAGAIIGSDACLVGRDLNGNLMPLVSAGKVVFGKNVMAGYYSFFSKGMYPYEAATVGDYSIVGYNVDISHNVRLASNVLVLDQSQVCGNCVVDESVRIAPQAIVSNRLHIEPNVEITIGSVVVNGIKKGLKVAGNFAIEHSKFMQWHLKKLRSK